MAHAVKPTKAYTERLARGKTELVKALVPILMADYPEERNRKKGPSDAILERIRIDLKMATVQAVRQAYTRRDMGNSETVAKVVYITIGDYKYSKATVDIIMRLKADGLTTDDIEAIYNG